MGTRLSARLWFAGVEDDRGLVKLEQGQLVLFRATTAQFLLNDHQQLHNL